MSIIELDGLTRHFVVRRPGRRLRREKRVVRAVDGISFSVAEGECVGYIGANGAGKSTTVKMLTGILVPTSGLVRVCGLEPVRQRRELMFHGAFLLSVYGGVLRMKLVRAMDCRRLGITPQTNGLYESACC